MEFIFFNYNKIMDKDEIVDDTIFEDFIDEPYQERDTGTTIED